jgi:hypothetical protein
MRGFNIHNAIEAGVWKGQCLGIADTEGKAGLVCV